MGSPWTVLGFWNAVIGLWLIHGPGDAVAKVAPFVAAGDSSEPVRVDTAILLTLRNEDPGRALQRLRVVKQCIDARVSATLSLFRPERHNDPVLAIEEEAMAHAWALNRRAASCGLSPPVRQ